MNRCVLVVGQRRQDRGIDLVVGADDRAALGALVGDRDWTYDARPSSARWSRSASCWLVK